MTLHEEQKISIMYGLSGTFALGWATSPYFRCSMLVLVPNILGKEGRTYVTIAVMASLYAGPIGNLQHNIKEVARSVSCTVDLQINHTKRIWKEMTRPMRKIVQDLADSSKKLKNRTRKIVSLFKDLEDEVDSTEGYSKQKEKEVKAQQKVKSTQKKVELKTMLRCEYVVELGIQKCKDWFAQKHEECMRIIWLPLLNTLLCLPMKFSFVCNVIYLVTKWCKNRVPLEGNFGNSFDLVNETVHSLDKGFSSTLVVRKEERDMLVGINITRLSFTEEAMETLKRKEVWVLRKMPFINAIMSCMFIFLFTSAFNYTVNYNTNILHDNFYVTTYFRQIDAHRRRLKKKYLLPMRDLEKMKFVFPFSLKVQKPEMKTMMMEILQCLPFFIFFILTISIDRFLIAAFQIIHKHFQVSYVFSIDHKLQILVGGDSFLSEILQDTVGAFNSSSNTNEIGDNTVCLPNPTIMSFTQYVFCSLPTVGLLSLCIVQVYSNRLRRVIASFFFPKREKRRVIFLYNDCLTKKRFYLKRIPYKVMRKCKDRQLWEKSFLGKRLKNIRWTKNILARRCLVCEAKRTKDSYECKTPGCFTVYCSHCWLDMSETCWACVPYQHHTKDTSLEYMDDSP
ncbi:E3 ubiquitin-protein ligase DCST1 isoform X2 [Engystomops pustulosus]